MSDPILTLYYDAYPNKAINKDTGSTTVNVTTPNFYRNNHYTIEVHLYYEYPNTLDVSGLTDWHLGIGNIGSTGPLIETTDVDTSNAASGVITFANANSHSVSFVADIGSKSAKQYACEITANDGVNDNTLMLSALFGKSTIY